MKNALKLFLAVAIIGSSFTACKSKQKITKVPAGATVQATTTAPVETTPATTTTTTKSSTTGSVRTANESFSFVEGDNEAMKSKFHVVVGSFKTQSNAQNLQSKLKAEGNKSLIVINESGMYRVLMASFNDYNEAHSFIKKITDRFEGAWVLVQK